MYLKGKKNCFVACSTARNKRKLMLEITPRSRCEDEEKEGFFLMKILLWIKSILKLFQVQH